MAEALKNKTFNDKKIKNIKEKSFENEPNKINNKGNKHLNAYFMPVIIVREKLCFSEIIWEH